MAQRRTARWTAGDDIVIAWPGGIALVDAAVGLAAAERIWTRLHRDSQLGTFLKALAESAESGFLDLPTFAVAVFSADRCHIAVRGPVPVRAQVDGALEAVSGDGVTTWAERVLPLPEAIRIGDALDPQASGPVADAVLPGSGVERGEFCEAATPAAAPVALPAPPPEADVATPQAAAIPEADPDPDRTRTGHTVVPEPADDEPETPEPNPYYSLWDPSVADSGLDVDTQLAPPGPAHPADGQLFDDTVVDEEMLPGAIGKGPMVLARFCDRGHPNPPERAACFVCESPVSGEARMAERPPLGYVRVEGGETVPLKGPIIAGRNPKSTALGIDETPRLLALPHAHVSGTHLAFLMEGWRVMVQDLKSSNGTYLRRHGKPAVRLPDTAVPLIPGDLIDLGKGLFLHLEGTP